MANDDEIFFQAIHLTTVHPKTGKQKTHLFAGKSIFSPEEIKEFGDTPIEDIIVDLQIDKPYNPYTDETNDKAAQKALKAIREALKDTDNG